MEGEEGEGLEGGVGTDGGGVGGVEGVGGLGRRGGGEGHWVRWRGCVGSVPGGHTLRPSVRLRCYVTTCSSCQPVGMGVWGGSLGPHFLCCRHHSHNSWGQGGTCFACVHHHSLHSRHHSPFASQGGCMGHVCTGFVCGLIVVHEGLYLRCCCAVWNALLVIVGL